MYPLRKRDQRHRVHELKKAREEKCFKTKGMVNSVNVAERPNSEAGD